MIREELKGRDISIPDAPAPVVVAISWGNPECPTCRRMKAGGVSNVITCHKCFSKYKVYDVCYPNCLPTPQIIYKTYLIYKKEV